MSDTYPADGDSPERSPTDTSASPGGGRVKREAEAAKQKLGEAGQALKAEAQSFAQGARSQASERADQATTRVGSTIHSFADAVRKAGDELGERDQTFASRVVREAADGLETLSRALAEKRPEEMLDSIRDFGRRQPAAFIAGSVLAGLALGRFIRASERNLSGESGQGLRAVDYPVSQPPDQALNADEVWMDRLTDPAIEQSQDALSADAGGPGDSAIGGSTAPNRER